MANAREIKSRISSVQDTMKITNAMYLISSSKLKKAKKDLAATEPYFDKLLYAELFKTEDKKRCTECGTSFASTSNSVKYCPDCRKRITRRQAAERMRKRRAAVTR